MGFWIPVFTGMTFLEVALTFHFKRKGGKDEKGTVNFENGNFVVLLCVLVWRASAGANV